MTKKQNKILFTSESVSDGHPDKICDQIADKILDELLTKDKDSRVACEVIATKTKILITGEITTTAKIDYIKCARNVLKDIGYSSLFSYDPDTVEIELDLNIQSRDIALGVDVNGAGDQGMMFGFASNETKGFMPLAIVMAHKLLRVAEEKRKSGEFKYAGPDMKSQVTIDYTNPYKSKIDTILMSVQHTDDYNEKEFKDYIYQNIMLEVAKSFEMNTDFKVLINPTGRFVIGGPAGDTGLTGRKIIVDTYGGYAKHGGGSFSGKDATKVDRSAAYMSRYIAKNIVAAGLADKIEIQVSYAIGIKEPISININTFGTAKINEDKIIDAINANFDLTPNGIISYLKLKEPIYYQTAKYGHFGRNEFPWERLDKVEILKEYLPKKKESKIVSIFINKEE